MDLTDPLMFLSFFVFASISLFLIYKYGIKKKSYEEALAEHRKQTSALFGSKPKPKEKKNKKAAKKLNKEKLNVNTVQDSETPDDVESVDSKDLSEPTENLNKPQAPQSKSVGSKGKTSSKQNKTHVEFKEEPQEVPAEVPAEKEVKEVINKREDVNKPEAPKEEKKTEKLSKKNKQHKQDTQQQQQVEKVSAGNEGTAVEKEKPKEEKAVENIAVPLMQEPVLNAGKEKKKKKSEYNSRQQMTAERDHLIQTVRNAELSRTEVQSLIDLLLNKQLEAPAVIDEWSEGKFDPIQKLKKQLAEKEKQLGDEQDALAGVQAKLKEVRNEQLAERAQLQLRLRAAEDSRVEIMAVHNRLQQKIQEMEDYRNKELANFQRVVEENKALQIQRGQLEATLMNYQETDALINTLKTENARLSNDLQLLTQERHEQVTNYQNCVLQIQTLQEELSVANEYARAVERSRSHELIAEQEKTRNLVEQLQRTSEAYLEEEQKLRDIVEQLQAENEELQEKANMQINGSAEENKEHEVEVLNLANKLTSAHSELSSVNQSLLEAERRYQTDLTSSQETYNQLKIELEEQKNKNDELRKKNWKVMEALNAAESRNKPASNIDQVISEIKAQEENAQKEFIQRLFPEIESLKSVSTHSNWQDEYQRVILQHVSQLQPKTATPDSPEKTGEVVTKLQSEVQHYKKIIDETESMLKKLESHIEHEERNWRNSLNQKDEEIQELKNHSISQLQVKVSTLENQLAEEQAEKARLLDERQEALNKPEVKTVHSDATATIEKLSEEVNRLREQLSIEQTKNSEDGVLQNAQGHKSTNGQTYIEGDTS